MREVFDFYTRQPTRVPPIGDGTTPKYDEVTRDGVTTLEIVGKDNLFEFVQASKEETLVYNIISRYQRGDINALNQRVGQYMDVVGMPTNLAEAHQVLISQRRVFDSLPLDIRNKFNNDFNVYVATVAKSSPAQLQTLFGVTAQDVSTVEVKDGDN